MNKNPFLYTKQKVRMKNMPQGKKPTVWQMKSDRNKRLKENPDLIESALWKKPQTLLSVFVWDVGKISVY